MPTSLEYYVIFSFLELSLICTLYIFLSSTRFIFSFLHSLLHSNMIAYGQFLESDEYCIICNERYSWSLKFVECWRLWYQCPMWKLEHICQLHLLLACIILRLGSSSRQLGLIISLSPLPEPASYNVHGLPSRHRNLYYTRIWLYIIIVMKSMSYNYRQNNRSHFEFYEFPMHMSKFATCVVHCICLLDSEYHMMEYRYLR